MSESARDLLVRGVAAGKAGEAKEARFFLEWVLRSDPSADQRTEACLWLSDLSESAAEKRSWLEEVLAYQPSEARARRKLALLSGGLRADEVVDPDALPPAPLPASDRPVLQVDCPSCGAVLLALVGVPRLGCAYCGAVINVEAAGKRLRSTKPSRLRRRGSGKQPEPGGAATGLAVELARLRGHRPPAATLSIACRGCGAVFIVPPDRPSLHCPYCHAVHVVDTSDTASQMAPDYLLPAQIDRDAALAELSRWGKEDRIDTTQVELDGFYLPFWAFEIGGEITAREIREDPDREGSLIAQVDRLPLRLSLCVPATSRHPELLAEIAQATPADSAVPFEPLLLAGWLAETYQIPLSQAAIHARGEAIGQMRSLSSGWFRGRPSYDTSGVVIEDFRLLLIPLWLGQLGAESGGGPVCVHGITGRVYTE